MGNVDTPLTRDDLLAVLRDIRDNYAQSDTECAHVDADEALVNFINDSEVTAAYNAINKWFA